MRCHTSKRTPTREVGPQPLERTPATCHGKDEDDPEYIQLIQKQSRSNPENEIEMISEEKRHIVRKQAVQAIMASKWR